jgi:hypothetical protein
VAARVVVKLLIEMPETVLTPVVAKIIEPVILPALLESEPLVVNDVPKKVTKPEPVRLQLVELV